MLFKPKMLEAILNGHKTKTRRVVVPQLAECHYGGPKDFILAVELPSGSPFKLEIISLEKKHLQEIDEKDAIAEGFPNRDAFIRFWKKVYGRCRWKSWGKNPLVWVIEFKKVQS